jgi:TRAP-type C4-dicarboxylate transport system permease small subunit
MEGVFGIVERISKALQVVAGIALTFIIILTDADVFLRLLGRPIIGTYEIVSLSGAVVIGFAIPMTSWLRGHIYVDFLYQKLSRILQNGLNIITRLIGIGAFGMIGWNLFLLGLDLYTSGEVSLTRHLPFYPVAFGLGACCFMQCVVLITDIFKIIGGTYE